MEFLAIHFITLPRIINCPLLCILHAADTECTLNKSLNITVVTFEGNFISASIKIVQA